MTTTVRISQEKLRALKILAGVHRRVVHEVADEALAEYLAKEEHARILAGIDSVKDGGPQ